MAEMPRDEPGRTWWQHGTLYQIYPRSYQDSDGDGVGDLRGIIERLDHLAWLGVVGIWLDPITVSPDADWGYDVADFTDVQPVLGTLADADELVAEASRRGIRVLLDLVPNHTSDQHAWFRDARTARDARYRDFYVWADPGPDGGPPNNWISAFGTGTPAWTFDDATGQYYLHNFLPEQPDLNWWNPEVRDAFDRILRFWFDRGVAGFRIDVVHMVVKDRELRDNPPTTADDHWFERLRGQRQVYNANRPEVHDVLRRWRRVADSYDPPRILVGETHVFDAEALAAFHGSDDELHLGFNFLLLHARFDAPSLRGVVAATEAALPPGAWPVWTIGNHDTYRFVTRWCEGDPARVRLALLMLLTLRGTPFLYYGDEIGMADTEVPVDRLLDPVGIALAGAYGRDPERTPMHWQPDPGAGFTEPGVEPWLPFGDAASCNVADQLADPGSVLHLTRDLVALRRSSDDLHRGDYRELATEDDARGWAFARGDRTVVVLNLSDQPLTVPAAHGTIRIATDRARDGERVTDSLVLGPHEGAVVEDDGPGVGTGEGAMR